MSVKQVADLIGVTGQSVRRFERLGKLPGVRVGNGERMFLPFEIQNFLAERRAKLHKAGRARARWKSK